MDNMTLFKRKHGPLDSDPYDEMNTVLWLRYTYVMHTLYDR